AGKGPGGPPHEPPIAPWEVIVIGIATSLAFSAILAWYLARPIRSLRWAFGESAAGHLETRVSPRMGSRRDELADLGRDFDRMAARTKERVDLAHIAASIAEDARFEAETLKRNVRFNASGDAPVIASADLLHRAVENIVRNAIKFTKEGTTVDVQVHTTRTS